MTAPPHPSQCFRCHSTIETEELQHVDFELAHLDEEEREILMDELPAISPDLGKQYMHHTDQGIPVINLCMACYAELFQRYLEDDS